MRCTPKGIDATKTFNPIESELDSKQVDKRETSKGEGTIMWDLLSTVPIVGFADAFKDSNIPFIVYIPVSLTSEIAFNRMV